MNEPAIKLVDGVEVPLSAAEQGEVAAEWKREHRVTGDQVNAERERRIAEGFSFQGLPYDFDPLSRQRIVEAAMAARFALASGAKAGDTSWLDPAAEFAWIAADNSRVPMDAPTCAAFGAAAIRHEQAHVLAARALKDRTPIPHDYRDNDAYWPTPAR